MHQNKLIDETAFEVLNAWFEFCEKELRVIPDIIVYLRTIRKKAIEIIMKRGRAEEKDINLDYELHNLYERWLMNNNETKIIIIEVNANLDLNKFVIEYQNCFENIM